MEPQKLLAAIDKEINLHFRREESFDIQQLVDSYDLDEKYKQIVTQYVIDVRDLYSRTCKKISREAEDIGEGIGCVGMVVSPTIGAAIGAVIGYFVDGPKGAGEYATGGASLGFVAELAFRPITILVAYKYSKLRKIENTNSACLLIR